MTTKVRDGTDLAGTTEGASGSSEVRADAEMTVAGKTPDGRAVRAGEVHICGDRKTMPASSYDEAESLHRVELDRAATRGSAERPGVARQSEGSAGGPKARNDARRPFQDGIDEKIREVGNNRDKLKGQDDLEEKVQESLSDRIQRKTRAQDLITGGPGATSNESANASEVAKERAMESFNNRLGRKIKESWGKSATKLDRVIITGTHDDKMRQKVQKNSAGQASIAGAQGSVSAPVASNNRRDLLDDYIGRKMKYGAKPQTELQDDLEEKAREDLKTDRPVTTMNDSASTSVLAMGKARESLNERILRKIKSDRASSTNVLATKIRHKSQKDPARRENMDRSVRAPMVRSNMKKSYEDLIRRKMREAGDPQAELTVDESVHASEVAKEKERDSFNERLGRKMKQSWREAGTKTDRVTIAETLDNKIRQKVQKDLTGQANIAGSLGSVSAPAARSNRRDPFDDHIGWKMSEGLNFPVELQDDLEGKAHESLNDGFQRKIRAQDLKSDGPVADMNNSASASEVTMGKARDSFYGRIVRKIDESGGKVVTKPDRAKRRSTSVLEDMIQHKLQKGLARKKSMDRSVSAPVVRSDTKGSYGDLIGGEMKEAGNSQTKLAVSAPAAKRTSRASFDGLIERKMKESRGEAATKPDRSGIMSILEDKIYEKVQKDSTGQASIDGSQGSVSTPVAKSTLIQSFEDRIERKMKERGGEAATKSDRANIIGTLEKKILQKVQEDSEERAGIARSQESVGDLVARSTLRPSFEHHIERRMRETANPKAALQDKKPPSIAPIKDITPTKLANLDTPYSMDEEDGGLGEGMEITTATGRSPSSTDEDDDPASTGHLDQDREMGDLDTSNNLSPSKHDSLAYLAEAYLVEEDSDSRRDVVIDAYAEPLPPWWKNSRVKALLAAVAVVVSGSAIAVGVTLQSDPLIVTETVAPTISAPPSMVSSLIPSVSQEPSSSPSACALTVVTRRQKLDLSFFNPSKPKAAVDRRNMVTAMIDSKTKSLHVVFYLLKGDEWERVNFLVETIDINFPAEFSLSLSGRKALLGVPFADPFAGNFGGLVYVYEQNDRGLWEAKGHLALQDPNYSYFGYSVDVDGDFAVVSTCDIIGMHDESFYFFRQIQSGWKKIKGIDLPSVKHVLISERTIAVSGERIYLYQYDEDLDEVELFQALSDRALALALSSKYLIYSTISPRDGPKKTYQNELFVYHREYTNQTYSMYQQLSSEDYEDDFGNSLAFEKDLLVVGGSSKTYVFSLQDGSWGQLAVLDESYDSYQVSGRNLLAMEKSGDVYCFSMEGCAPSPTQVPSLSMPPTVKQSFVPSRSMNPSVLPSLSTIPSSNPSASQSPSVSVLSPSTTPTYMPTSIRFLEVIKKLTPLSGEKLILQGTPQNRAAKWMADKDPILNPSTGETGLDLADPRFEQRYIMALFYFAMDGDNWLQADGWLSSTSECKWFGINGASLKCGGEGVGGCVRRSNLDGDYDKICRIDMVFGNGIRGQIPNELGYLSEMRWFKIQYNDLTGTIPDTFGTGWTKLHSFLASNNHMHGGFPDTFENNQMLGTIFIDKNRFNSTFPSVFATLKNLEWLRAEDNDFVGGLPAGMGSLKYLKTLNVTNNSLSGRLPDTWDESNQLEELEITDNDFTGPLPASLGNVRCLKDFHASRNQLTGSLPVSYYSFQNLEELYLDGNSMAGELPQTDVPLYNGLQELSIHSNGFSGHFPIEHFEETFRLKVLSLHNNQLTGTVTENICSRRDPSRAYTQLIELTADCDMVECKCCTCYEDGELVSMFSYPTDTSSPTTRPTGKKQGWADQVESINRPTKAPNSQLQYRDHLVILDHIESTVLQRNAVFDGMDESDPRYLALDWILQKDRRKLTTDDKNLPQRYILALIAFSLDSLAWYACGEHRHLGNVAEEFTVQDCEVTNHDKLTETWKVWLSNADECWWYGVICSSDGVVRGLELINNNLIGEIPPEISQLLLQYLALNNNCLYGTIPPELGQMPYLLSMDLHLNGLSGIFPHEIYDASQLQLLNVANQFDNNNECRRSNGAIVNTLYDMGDPSGGYNWGLEGQILGPTVNRWTKMKGLHVSDNSFTGWIDENIGDLNHLVLLQVYNNLLSGSIPHDVSKLKNLRELGLGKNSLESSLPPYIGQMEDLKELVALENSLTGTIPESLYDLRKLNLFWLSDMTIDDPSAGLGGELSTKIGNLKQLSELYVDSNPLTGTLPTELGSCENLSILWIHKTKIGGTVPEEVCRLRDKNLCWPKADCLPNSNTQKPAIQCGCCSVCCDHTTEVCITIADD